MNKRQTELFEQAWRQDAQGEIADGPTAALVEAARQVKSLSATPPPAPHGLVPGRQQFLAEAARLRSEKAVRRPHQAGVMRLATALVVIALLLGAVLGAIPAAAGSLPGEPLYGIKRATEQIRLALTSQPSAQSALEQALAEERLDEIVALLKEKQAISTTIARRAVRQMEKSLASSAQLQDPLAAQALGHWAEAIQQREQALLKAAGQSPDPPVPELLRETERLRREAQAGAADPEGLRLRLRQGMPAEPTGRPGAGHTPQAPAPSRTHGGVTTQAPSASSSPGPVHTPRRTSTPQGSPGPGSTPSATAQPTRGAQTSSAPEPTASPHASASPQTPHTPNPTATSRPTGGPPTSPTPEPPYASRTPGPGGTPGPTGGPSGTPGAGETPGPGDSGNKP